MEDVGYKHQLKIARDTLKVNPAMIPVMGGMTLAEAEAFVTAADVESLANRVNANLPVSPRNCK